MPSRKRRLRFWLFFGLIALAILAVAFGGYSITYAHRAYLNVKVGDFSLGGKNQSGIEAVLNRESEQFLKKPIVLKYQPLSDEEKSKLEPGAKPAGEKDYEIKAVDIGLSIDVDKSVDKVMAIGRSGNILKSFGQQLLSIFWPQKVGISYSVNQEALNKKIASISEEIDQPEKDYTIKYENGKFILLTERKAGFRVNQQKLTDNVKFQISNVKNNDINFKADFYEPKVTEKNANLRLVDANKIITDGGLNLNYDDEKYTLEVDTIAGMLASRPDGDDLKIYIIPDRLLNQVNAIAKEIDREPENAVLGTSGGVVTISKVSKTGRSLDQAQTILDIDNALFARIGRNLSNANTRDVRLTVTLKNPEIDSAAISGYGLKELVAVGETSFAKSPSNRIHNITVGANALNGVLIKPGEEFSTLSRLGKIDASTGYLPELVIKESKTVPEYGGGLCQVSTTLFRAALNAGMTITDRRNHSYRVSYYEPPIGMDATIYDPAPDFKFVNNYDSYILIQSHVSGSKISFEFYGTKDSRQVEIGVAVGYDYVSPPTPIEVQTDTLAAGERQLLEHGHQGASAKFHYKVSRDGQILQETDFLSKYAALPEKWLVGTGTPAPADPTAPDPNATPTP